MPKASRTRAGPSHHASSAKLAHRFSGNAASASSLPLPNLVDIGSMENASANEILSAIEASAPQSSTPHHLKKKEKQALKHQAFVDRLASAQTPYSRSHTRREKRKAKQQLVTKMDDLDQVLDDLGSGPASKAVEIPGVTTSRKRETSSAGQIGEGKGSTLSKNQRRATLKTEKTRMNIIQSTKEFSQNPFELIRKHAQATLAPRTAATDPPSST